MLWPFLQIFVWCAVQLCDGQSARVITVNATIASKGGNPDFSSGQSQ